MERKGMIEASSKGTTLAIKFSYKAVYEKLIQPRLMWYGNNPDLPKEVADFFAEMSDRADKWLDAQVPGVTSKTVSKLKEDRSEV
jgi:hypothetical protein